MGSAELRDEAHADVAGLLDDLRSARAQIERAPDEIRYISRGLASDAHYLLVDLKADAVRTKEHFSDMFRGGKDQVSSGQTPQNQR